MTANIRPNLWVSVGAAVLLSVGGLAACNQGHGKVRTYVANARPDVPTVKARAASF
jgi:hypothetical protein